MADKVRTTMTVYPYETPAIEHGTASDVIASEINTAWSITTDAAVTDYSGTAAAQGYKDQTVNYLECVDSVDTTDISAETTASFVMIKNTGSTFSSATALGATLAKSVKVMVGTTLIALLDSGEGIILKDDNATIDCTGIHVRTVDTDGSDNAAAGHLAVERLIVD